MFQVEYYCQKVGSFYVDVYKHVGGESLQILMCMMLQCPEAGTVQVHKTCTSF